MPVKLNSTISYFDGPPIVSGAGLCVHKGHLTEMVDLFDQPFWDSVRNKASEKSAAIREQGFFGAAMLGMNELEYGGIVERLKELEKKFKIRE
jgi:fructose 1,6-bisphosphate aldolase/phosphatase